MNVKVEIICVGNELLIGKTLNTNSHWLAKQSTGLGASVHRITVVGDEVTEIGLAIREALKRKPRFIITTGGLGPTFDDKTMEGMAWGLTRKLCVNDKALEIVRGKYKKLLKEGRIEKIELTPSRLKMATLPERTSPIPNPVGTAPGMLADVRGTSIIALPGVPPEMEAIFVESVAPLIKKETKSAFFEASIYIAGVMESSLAPLIDATMRANPSVYVKSHVYTKSHPQIEGKKSHIELHFSTTGANSSQAKKRLDKSIAHLSDLIVKNGGNVMSTQTT
jgi:molybdenum cofactor synthesis domain-containing protein